MGNPFHLRTTTSPIHRVRLFLIWSVLATSVQEITLFHLRTTTSLIHRVRFFEHMVCIDHFSTEVLRFAFETPCESTVYIDYRCHDPIVVISEVFLDECFTFCVN